MLCNDVQMIGGRHRFEKYAYFSFFADFRGDSSSLAFGMPRKVPFTNREVVLSRKNYMKRAFRGQFISSGVQMFTLGPPTAAAAANVTNDSFKSSPVPLQTTSLDWKRRRF